MIMISVALIRHSITEGNKLKRYIGVTDEPLCMEGIKLIEGRTYPDAQAVYVSPMARCRETAMIIYPDKPHIVMEDFREIDFGRFENKNYKELSGDRDYQAWIDSNGTLPFPGGESQESFEVRCLDAFFKMLQDARGEDYSHIAAVVHGGTIMVIMNHFLKPEDYYKYRVDNGEGYILKLEFTSGGNDVGLKTFSGLGGEE